MATTSATKLKITAVNIRSVLNTNNKTLEKLNSKKTTLSRRLRLKAERDAAEKNLEKKPKKGPIKSIFSNISTTVMSMKDKILNFFGYLLMGMLVNNLPAIIRTLKKAFNFVKPLIKIAWKVISFIAKSLWKFGGWLVGLFDRKKAEENTDLLYTNSTVLENEISTMKIPSLEGNEGDTQEIQESKVDWETKYKEAKKINPEAKIDIVTGEITVPKSNRVTGDPDKRKSPKMNINSQISDMTNDNKINKIINKTNMSSSIFNNKTLKKVVSKIKNKNSRDLVGNLDNQTNTVIIPIEVEKMVSTNRSNGKSNSINSVKPLTSVGSDMRMP